MKIKHTGISKWSNSIEKVKYFDIFKILPLIFKGGQMKLFTEFSLFLRQVQLTSGSAALLLIKK